MARVRTDAPRVINSHGLLEQCELHHVIVTGAEIMSAASEVMHVHVVGVFVGDGDGLLSARAQIVRPHV